MTPPVPPQAWQFRDNFYSLVPGWLATGNGERFFYTLETCRDLLCEKGYQAMTIRLPGVGDASNLPLLAYDRALSQGPAESNASFAGRLTEAFATWGQAGSARAVIGQLQAYMQGLQPGVPALPAITIVSTSSGTIVHPFPHTGVVSATWNQVYQGTPVGAPPAVVTVSPANFVWDGQVGITWRAWLILPMALAPIAGLLGSSASITTSAPSACYMVPGQIVGGVAVPATSGTPVNSPWITVTGLSGLTSAQVGQWLTLTGAAAPANNGVCPIVSVTSATSCIIANPVGVAAPFLPVAWTVGAYPWIGPGPVWGAPGYVFGLGEGMAPPLDTGSIPPGQGVAQPSTATSAGTTPALSWGLNCRSAVIESVRAIVRSWKSAGTYYPNIVVAFDCGTGAAGTAYSPNSSTGSGNPGGTFGSVGSVVNGVAVPTRLISSPFDAYCQGTGVASFCSIENIT